MRTSTLYYTLSGALGGALGFALMEVVRTLLGGPAAATGSLLFGGAQFAAFGMAVGGALGATQGWYFRQRAVLLRGAVVGGLLGLLGGFLGGGFGQWIFNRVPIEYASRSKADIAIVLDSSGSMSGLLFSGNDPWGQRRKAAKALIEHLSTNDRVAVVDFDDKGTLVFPLTRLDGKEARRAAKEAVDTVDSSGGTNLDAGLGVAIAELGRGQQAGRPQTILFLTDGAGTYSESTGASARQRGITVHTVGLGSEVDSPLLERLASATGGRYFSAARASDLIAIFEQIRVEASGDMAGQRSSSAQEGEEERRTSPFWLWLVRIASWAAMGLMMGLGQGLRDNSWEDLKSCGMGGMLGGAIGGALIEGFQLGVGGGGFGGRLLADVLVGALIGGSLRLIKNASESRMAAARTEKTAIVGGLAIGEKIPGRQLGAW